jgi:hypothetical protein
MIIFLLSGWSGSGKDTVGKILQSKYNFQRLAFADVLKKMVADEFKFPVELCFTDSGKQTKITAEKTVRDLLIQRGQEIRAEKNDPGFFAKIISAEILKIAGNSVKPTGIVITDWRLPIELETLQETLSLPIKKIRIKRSNMDSSAVKDQETESQLDNWIFDTEILNIDGNPEQLETEIKNKLAGFFFDLIFFI